MARTGLKIKWKGVLPGEYNPNMPRPQKPRSGSKPPQPVKPQKNAVPAGVKAKALKAYKAGGMPGVAKSFGVKLKRLKQVIKTPSLRPKFIKRITKK